MTLKKQDNLITKKTEGRKKWLKLNRDYIMIKEMEKVVYFLKDLGVLKIELQF